MICAFCSAAPEAAIADSIVILDGECPSGCDDGIIVRIRCPECGQIIWAKTISQSYVSSMTFPEWVEIAHAPRAGIAFSDDFFVDTDGDDIYLYHGAYVYASGDLVTDDLPGDAPPGASLEIFCNRWIVRVPSEKICRIVKGILHENR